MLDILMDVVKLSFFPPVTTARVGNKTSDREGIWKARKQQPNNKAQSCLSLQELLRVPAPPLDYLGLVLSAGVKLSLHLKCRVISQPCGCKGKGFVHRFLKPKSTFNDEITAAEVQVLEAAGGARYKVVQRNLNCSKADFLACSTLLSALSLQTAWNI